jgi:hypothetical protein
MRSDIEPFPTSEPLYLMEGDQTFVHCVRVSVIDDEQSFTKKRSAQFCPHLEPFSGPPTFLRTDDLQC